MAKPIKKNAKKAPPLTQIFLGAAILLVVVLVAAIFTSRNIKTDRTVLSTCGQEQLLLRHYMYFLNTMRYEYESEWSYYYGYSAADIAEIWKTVEEGVSYGDLLKGFALEQAQGLFSELYLAKQAGFAPTSETIRESAENIDYIISSVFPGSNTPNSDFFGAYGLTIEEMKELEIYIKLVSDWRNSVMERTIITDEQAYAHFTDSPEEFEKVTTRHILISTIDAESEAEVTAAEELANELLERINDGEPIGGLVAEYSDDTYSIENEGEYEFARGEMVAEYEDWAFSAAVGDTGIVKTDYGFHVMQLMKGPSGFDELKGTIIDTLRDEEGNRTITEAVEAAGLDWKLNENVFKRVKI